MAIEQVAVRFVADIQQYAKNVQEAQKLVKNFASTNESATNQIAADLKRMAASYLGLAAAVRTIQKIVKEGMDFNTFVETSTAAFGVMMKSTDAAKMKMQELYDWAVKSPLTFKETVAASKQLLAYGFSADKLVSTMETLGTVSKATGHSLDDIAYVYGTLKTQGRAYTRDLMQFAMRGIPIYDELAKVLGKPKEEIQKLTEAGKVGFAEIQQAFINMTTGEGVYAGFLQEYMKTFEGKMSMLADVWQKSAGALTSGMFSTLKPAIDDLTRTLTENQDAFITWGNILGGVAQGVTEAITVVSTVVGPLVKGLGDLVTWIGKLNINWDVVIASTGLFVTMLNPLVGGVMLLAEGLSYAVRMFGLFNTATVSASDKVREYQRALVKKNIETSKTQAETDDKAWEKARKAFERYRDEYMSWLMSISDDPYAKLDYEYTKKVAELKQTLSGDNYNTALQYITLQYQYERAQIQKTLEAKKQANMDASLDAILSKREQVSAPYYESVGMGADYMRTQKSLAYAQLEVESLYQKLESDRQLADSAEIEATQKRIELWENILAFWEYEALPKSRGANPKMQDVQISQDEISAIYKNVFSKVTGGSTAIWSKLQEQAGASFKAGNWLKGYATSAMAGLQGTGVGKLVEGYTGRKEEGMGGGLNAFITAIQAAAGPIGIVVKFISNIVKQSKPMMDLLDAITASVSGALMPVITSLAEGFAWLYDYVIVPVGNAIIRVINGLIKLINKLPGVNIRLLNELETTTEALKKMNAAATAQEALTETIGYLQDKLDDLISNQLDSLADLYEVGAITAAEYASQAEAISEQYNTEKTLVSYADQQLNTLDSIYDRLSDLLAVQEYIESAKLDDATIATILEAMGLTVTDVAALSAAAKLIIDEALARKAIADAKAALVALMESFKNFHMSEIRFHLNKGSGNIPQDMPANIHKGEMVVPADFSSAIRRGDLTLGSGSSGGETINVSVTVNGSVQKEKDLAKSIAEAIYSGKKSGNITVSLA